MKTYQLLFLSTILFSLSSFMEVHAQTGKGPLAKATTMAFAPSGNIARSKTFYSDILGLKLESDSPHAWCIAHHRVHCA